MNNYIILSHKQSTLQCEVILKNRFFDGIIEKNNYHFHSLFEVHICTRGNMHISVEDKDILLSQGEICIIPPHKTHCSFASEDTLATGFRFTFSNSGKTECDESLLFQNAFGNLKDVVVIANSHIYNNYLQVASENLKADKPHFICSALIFSALFEIAESLCQNNVQYNAPANPDIVTSESIEDFINLNYNKKIELEDISSHLNVSKRHTQRIIRKLFNMTFTELVNKKRLAAAKTLLKTTDKTIEEISYLCGFDDKNYFYRRFSAQFGTTPGKYRYIP